MDAHSILNYKITTLFINVLLLNRNAILGTKRDCDDEFVQEMQAREFSRLETGMGEEIFNFIESQRETGVTTDALKVCFIHPFLFCFLYIYTIIIRTLQEKFGDKWFIIIVLDILMGLNLVIRCGVKAYTFVYWLYVQPWVINTYNLKRLERVNIQ